MRNFCFFASKRESSQNDQKYLPFRFIIATFWSVGEKRSPFSRNLQNSSKFAKFLRFHKNLEISGNFSKFSKFQLFLRLVRKGCPDGQHTEAHTWKIPYVALRGRGVSVPIFPPSDSLLSFQVVDALIQTSVCMVRKVRTRTGKP